MTMKILLPVSSLWISSLTVCNGFGPFITRPPSISLIPTSKTSLASTFNEFEAGNRREFFLAGAAFASAAGIVLSEPAGSLAAGGESSSVPDAGEGSSSSTRRRRSVTDAEVTDRIFIDIRGLPAASDGEGGGGGGSSGVGGDRITIGLFGGDEPQPVSVLKQLVSSKGYPSKCKPREERLLQREQLEANKVYNSCIENEEKGVTYDYSQVWRVDKNRRIDVGSVSGKFVARESPTFSDGGTDSGLRHDTSGTVSVRRGNEGGFGFTIFQGDADVGKGLDEDHIVVGRILDGMDVVERINDIPVVQSSKLNYKAFAGGDKSKTAPSRACRYGGGELYCNELKPLKKLVVSRTGIL